MRDLCDEVEKFGKGMSSATRYRIVEALFHGPKTVGHLVKAVKLSQPAVSQHLKTLKSCGIVTDHRKGQEVYYQLNKKYILGLLKNLFTEVNQEK